MHKYQDDSSYTDRKDLKHSSLGSPWRGASNGGIFMSLESIDEELFAFFCLQIFDDISRSTDPKDIKLPPFDASRCGESNGLCFVDFRSLDRELSLLNDLKKPVR